MSDFYDTDILAWSERQATLLRSVAARSGANDNPPDWPNIIEEIESVGRSQLSAVRSLLMRALEHLLKAEGWPLSTAAPGWLNEARRFRYEAAEAFAPSMRQRIDLDVIYARALRLMPDTIDGQPPLPLPPKCPVTLDELLSDDG